MKRIKPPVAASLLLVVVLSGGCLRAVRLGAVDGVNSAISAVVEAILNAAFAPLTPGK